MKAMLRELRPLSFWLPCFLGLSLSAQAQSEGSGSALALISVKPHDAGIEIVGSALAIDDGHFKGELVISRQGVSGSVSTRQAREFDLSAGEAADIARVGISHNKEGRLEVTVTLKQDGKVIAKASLSTSEQQ